MTRHVYIGTFTRPAPYLDAANGEGLYVGRYDEHGGGIEIVQVVDGIENPSYVNVAPDGRTVHAIWEVLAWDRGLVSTYQRDPDEGTLRFANVQSSRGALACYVSTATDGRYTLVANFMSGSVAYLPRRPDGTLAEASDVQQHEGSGPDERQDGPHAHCIVLDPAERFAFAADLGADAVFGYRIDADAERLAPTRRLTLPPGSGPRHLRFHPNDRFAYLVNELSGTIAALDYDADDGELELIDQYPLLPPDFHGDNMSADVALHPSGGFVYASNRGHDSVAMFSVDHDTGRLEPLGHRSAEGRTPRNLAMDPRGRFLLVANQDSDEVVALPVDPATGKLGEVAARSAVPTPVSVEFAP